MRKLIKSRVFKYLHTPFAANEILTLVLGNILWDVYFPGFN